ncbi:MAG: ABC transporter permease [Verrucomicrobia bacterium]|nr:ABC transporter permease [Verrucomicrobiota bacterium]
MPLFIVGATLSFLYLPMLVLLIFSFNAKAFPAPWDHFTLHWYYELFAHKELWRSFGNSCLIAIVTTFFCLTLSIFMIYYLSKGGRIKKMLPLFYGNLIVPETILGVSLISYFTLLNVPLGLFPIIIAHSIVGLGFMIPVLYVRYRDIDNNIFEASRVLGASSLQTFIWITLPLMRPALLTTGLILFILSFDDFILAYFCSGPSVQTLSLFLVSSIRYHISPVVNALASLLFLLTALFVLIFSSIRKKEKIL